MGKGRRWGGGESVMQVLCAAQQITTKPKSSTGYCLTLCIDGLKLILRDSNDNFDIAGLFDDENKSS